MSKLKNRASGEGKKRKKRKPSGDPLIEKFPLHLATDQITVARALQMEAARVWNMVCFVHRLIYAAYHIWLGGWFAICPCLAPNRLRIFPSPVRVGLPEPRSPCR